MTAGLAATVAIIIVSTGTLALSISAAGAAALYAGSIAARERRIQKRLNEEACTSAAALVRAKDAFAAGPIYLSDFGCSAIP